MQRVVITGGNRGIGKALASSLAAAGHQVAIVSRNHEQGADAVRTIKSMHAAANISFIHGDLSDISSCSRLVETIKQQCPDTNVLINNAGVWMTERQVNKDGIEVSFMVNYLASYILSTALAPLLEKNGPSRIINVNAGLYVKGFVDIDKTPYGLDFGSFKTYANSKLCSAMQVIDFAKELSTTNVSINAVHPGVIQTGLGDSDKWISHLIGLVKRCWKSPEYGAVAPAWLATSTDTEKVNGKYFNEKAEVEFSKQALDSKMRQRLREKTLELIETTTRTGQSISETN
jgi:NAD(P)-dependent dehydrogenase (short-subunit alcohol dehydrogenase family)